MTHVATGKTAQKRADRHRWRFCVAPMMAVTERHCRYFYRLLSHRARLYTPMLTADAIIYGDRHRLLTFSPREHPVALQLGGCAPPAMGKAARIGADFGYDEININVGCPSPRVQAGTFGACLMAEPDRVAACVAAMKQQGVACVSVKCRIAIDEAAPREMLWRFAEHVFGAGADALIVHARKAWLDGLSPADNRNIPPLDYPLVYALQAAWPNKPIVINGGIQTIANARTHQGRVAGVMLGRAVRSHPAVLLGADRFVTGYGKGADDAGDNVRTSASTEPPLSLSQRDALIKAVRSYGAYAAHQQVLGARLSALVAPLVGCFNAMPGARAWRRELTRSQADPLGSTDVEARINCALSHIASTHAPMAIPVRHRDTAPIGAS